jgi:hypothetical protein
LNQVNRLACGSMSSHAPPGVQPRHAKLDRHRGLAGAAFLLRDADDGAGHGVRPSLQRSMVSPTLACWQGRLGTWRVPR